MSPLTVAAVVLQRLAQAVKRNPCQPRAQRVIKKLQGAAELRRQLGEGRLDKTYITIQWEEHTTVKVQASHWWRQQGMKREMRWPCVQMVVELGLPAELLIDWMWPAKLTYTIRWSHLIAKWDKDNKYIGRTKSDIELWEYKAYALLLAIRAIASIACSTYLCPDVLPAIQEIIGSKGAHSEDNEEEVADCLEMWSDVGPRLHMVHQGLTDLLKTVREGEAVGTQKTWTTTQLRYMLLGLDKWQQVMDAAEAWLLKSNEDC